MNTVYQHKGFGWEFLFLGILFIIVSLVAFGNPMGSLEALAIVFGVMAIVSGVWFILNRFGSMARLAVGVLEILLGLLLIFYPGLGATVIALAFAVWFIADSISNLSLLNFYRSIGPGYYWFMLVVNILGIVLGVLMFIQPVISILTLSFLVGFYFMMVGIGYILLAFSRPTVRIETDGPDRGD